MDHCVYFFAINKESARGESIRNKVRVYSASERKGFICRTMRGLFVLYFFAI